MWRKRIIVMIVIIICSLTVLMGRLVQLQLASTEHFSKRQVNLIAASVKQRSQEMIIDNGRGSFLDRNGEYLVHKKMPVLILFPFLKNMTWDVERVAEIMEVSATALQQAIEEAKEPIAFGNPEIVTLTDKQMSEINRLEIPGVFAVEKKYSLTDYPAEQLIGITGQNPDTIKKRYPDKELPLNTLVGLTGLEKSFDEFLLPDGESKLVYHVDGIGGPLFGINVKYVEPANPFYPVNVKTTLDKKMQELAEELVDQHQIKRGGLVLLDIETNSILALVSRPNINKKAPFEEEGIHNMMVSQHIPGSVFKTVVAAAAIERDLDDPTREFDCDKTIMGKEDPNYQHGMLNFTESFALSCNNTFGTLAKELKELDEGLIEDYAKKLSLIGPVSWQGDIYHFEDFRQIAEEDKGRIFLDESAKKDDNFVAMTGIGQHEVRVTPLAVANMMATIARGGKGEMVRVATGIEYRNGTSLLPFEEKSLEDAAISPYTAMKLQKLLREVVVNEEGTGRGLQGLPYDVAGKSGTAETGIIDGDRQLLNKWFAGYFPFEQPKYALVAVNLGVDDSGGSVTPLFADMVKGLYELDHHVNEESVE
ncbi:penicillin-binding transpeptidase domain-containing protein [Robertmurraya sp. DFI.2.37]|uniref:peptidoglycan D,D-transpeptidase FtsI family protein n=1 Tax=Robertmurraya sp. DFI.2.37 TaxID=3031819 RepID=UPI001244BDED|nr:penicillin-binding transpeptidase domain-containing protein [Robertmurraya sp. DFI.2.37]MDF1508264.1 penicillin-binding transpeptidase domain-containing protein [Robertmurraya sp. DFI.2.37]